MPQNVRKFDLSMNTSLFPEGCNARSDTDTYLMTDFLNESYATLNDRIIPKDACVTQAAGLK